MVLPIVTLVAGVPPFSASCRCGAAPTEHPATPAVSAIVTGIPVAAVVAAEGTAFTIAQGAPAAVVMLFSPASKSTGEPLGTAFPPKPSDVCAPASTGGFALIIPNAPVSPSGAVKLSATAESTTLLVFCPGCTTKPVVRPQASAFALAGMALLTGARL